jgi:hypothetical protein
MSNFLFKGIPLNDVIDTTGTTSASKYNFNYRSTTFANSKPLTTTGYKVNGVDLANNAAARISTITSSTSSYTVPNGVTKIRYMICGGGGAGGSGGGERFSNAGYDSSSAGGAGGSGGRGQFLYGTANTFDNVLNINVGTGGPAQNTVGVATTGDNNNAGQPRSAGSKGPDGNSTQIIFNTTTIANAAGGGGGNGGDPGSTNAPDDGRQAAGGAGYANTAYTSNAEWDNSTLNAYGNNGNGGHGGGNAPGGAGGAGNNGGPGVVQLIWLYG